MLNYSCYDLERAELGESSTLLVNFRPLFSDQESNKID